MAVFFFIGFLGLLACVAFLVWSWQRRRQHLAQIVARLEPLLKGSSNRTRVYHMRQLSSNFSNEQLMSELEREVAILERERGLEASNHLERPLFSTKERLKQLEERIAALESGGEAQE